MKNPFALLLSISILLFACESTLQSQGYKVNGTLNNVPNETIYLDFLTMTDAQALDTVKTDSKGKFQFTGLVKEYGLVRIRTADNKAWMFLLNNKDNITLVADRNNMNVYTIKGGRDNNTFKMLNDYFFAANVELDQMNKRYTSMYQSGADPIATSKLKDSMTSKISSFENRFKTVADTSKNHILLIFACSFINTESDINFAKKVVGQMEKIAPTSVYTKQFKDRVNQTELQLNAQKMQMEREKNTAIGAIAPEINLKTPDGKELKLSSLRGNVVLLDFWASWCAPCRRENPSVVALYNKHKDNGFTVYSVSLDKTMTPWVNAIQADGLIWPNHVSDLAGWQSSAAALYGVTSIPKTFLLDKEGKIVATNLRGEELAKKVEEILISE